MTDNLTLAELEKLEKRTTFLALPDLQEAMVCTQDEWNKLIAAARRGIDGEALAKSVAIALQRKAEVEIDQQKFFESIMICLDVYARGNATPSPPAAAERGE